MNSKKPNVNEGGQDSQNPHNDETAGRNLLQSLEPSLWNSKTGRRAFVKRTGAATVGTAIALHGFRTEILAAASGMQERIESIVTKFSSVAVMETWSDTTGLLTPDYIIAMAFVDWAVTLKAGGGTLDPNITPNPKRNTCEVPIGHVLKTITTITTDSTGAYVDPGTVLTPPTAGNRSATVSSPAGQNLTTTVTFTYGPP